MPENGHERTEPLSLWKNRYRVEKELSRGGFGIVYLAHDEQLQSRPVVLKVLQIDKNLNPYIQRKFQQEIEALVRIDHPGVVGVLDEGESPDGLPFLVMQFVQGPTLRELIPEGGMPLARAAEIIRQAGNALGAAHDKGIYHRDLKPENIMLTRSSGTEEYVKLIDFGIAAVMNSQVAPHAEPSLVVGTLGYMAPEQVLGEGGAFSDIYAFGVIAFEMLAGQKPEMSPAGVSTGLRQLRPSVPEAAETIILKALSYQPENRPASPRSFAEQLCHALRPGTESNAVPAGRSDTEQKMEMAYILFMDIVAYSKLSTDMQLPRIQQLQEIVRTTSEFRQAQSAGQLVSMPTGDGMALAFFYPAPAVLPVQCALEISRILKGKMQLRIGIHTGPVYRMADINANQNVAGGGINLAQRVMDCGDAGHILVSKAMSDILGELSEWAPRLHDLGNAAVKHGVVIHVANLFTSDAGNPAIPTKLRKTKLLPQRRGGILAAAGLLLVLALGVLYGYRYAPSTASIPATLETPTGKMILIPGGRYLSGPDMRPVELPAFYIDQTEVTNEAYGRFAAATGRPLPQEFSSSRPDFPVINITIDDAREFARWAGKRLPRLGEWEKAARGTDGRKYSWGSDEKGDRANVLRRADGIQAGLAPVLDFAAADSPFGVRQILGNVSEFVDERREPSAAALKVFTDSGVLDPAPTAGEAWYLFAGGSYLEAAQPVYEFGYVPARFRLPTLGFRCVKDVP